MIVVLGIGNVLQKDDGFGVYASTYLKENYTFSKEVNIINGGVEGINLFSIFEENSEILILDTIELQDEPSSIYKIPSTELSGHGLNSGGAHEIGVIQCLDMLELQGKTLPKATVLGIVPKYITFDIGLSDILKDAFDGYISVILNFLKGEGIESFEKKSLVSLEMIIRNIKKI
jgi:hydrogenase maturation protease